MEDTGMPVVVKKVLDEVLQLPADARVNLVEQLLTSLNLPMQPEVDRLWADEAEKRIAEIDLAVALNRPARNTSRPL